MGEFQKDDRLELVHENGRPSHFKEKPRGVDSPPSISETWAAFMPAAKKFSPSSAGSSSPTTSLLSSREGQVTPGASPRVLGLGISGCTTPAGSYTSENELSAAKDGRSPDYGRRLLPQIIDELAASHPEQSLFSLSSMVKNVLEFRDVSARQFAKAVDKTAWWLQEKVGKPVAIQPIGYIGPRTFQLWSHCQPHTDMSR